MLEEVDFMNKKRIRDYGISIGRLPTGIRNNIADVSSVLVGHSTIDSKENKTGVTVILPTSDNIFLNKMPAAIYVLNGFGKSTGLIQIQELGTLESPIALTNTFNVGLVQDALVEYMIERCRQDGFLLKSFNPVVGECNDSVLNNITKRAVRQEHVFSAIENAEKDFEQGDVGAGKGTVCFGLKGGIGSASRVITLDGQGYTLGVLVQSNFGRIEDLTIQGFPIGTKIKKQMDATESDKGSIISIVATDIPLSSRQIHRILKRACIGLGRTGSYIGNGSGDIMIGFSTAYTLRMNRDAYFYPITILNDSKMDIVFRAVIEAEEEAILNSMIAADTVAGYTGKDCYSLQLYLEKYGTCICSKSL